MKRILIAPEEIWPFQADVGVSLPLTRYVQERGWKDIPPVPVFEIPQDVQREHSYILMDGNHRREVALHLELELPCALYEFGESIDTVRDGLASFRYSTDPKIYEKLFAGYQIRNGLHRRVMRRLERMKHASR